MPSLLNSLVKKEVAPILHDLGFQKIGHRKSYLWRGEIAIKFEIKSVGPHFSTVTRWPGSSFQATFAHFLAFLCDTNTETVTDTQGRTLPRRWPSMGGLGLTVTVDQTDVLGGLSESERAHRDLWWIDEREATVRRSVADLAEQLKAPRVREYIARCPLDDYRDRRQYFPPEADRLKDYVRGASIAGAKYWVDTMIRYSRHLDQRADLQTYEAMKAALKEMTRG